jgi:pilus assembly protein Flp/PilA
MRQMITTRVANLRSALRVRDDEGQGLAEYALIIGLIAVVCVGALGLLGDAIANSPGFSMF